MEIAFLLQIFCSHSFSPLSNFIFCSIELRPCVDPVIHFSWNNMDVEMTNRLTCAFTARIQKIYAVIMAVINTVV